MRKSGSQSLSLLDKFDRLATVVVLAFLTGLLTYTFLTVL